jgi:hypothetical protein
MTHYYTGQVAGAASTEFGLANMIWAGVVIGTVGQHFLQLSLP